MRYIALVIFMVSWMLSMRSFSSLVDGMAVASHECVPGVQDGIYLLRGDLARGGDGVHGARDVGAELPHKSGGLGALFGGGERIQHSVGSQRQGDDLLGVGFGLVQRLLEHFHQGFAVLQLAAGLGVQIRAELGERLHILVQKHP